MSDFYIGQIFEEMYPSEAAEWCNENKALMTEIEPTDSGRRFQIIEMPEPTEDEKKTRIRAIRDNYISAIEWRVSRYRDQKEMDIETTDSEYTYIKILRYMQYLRDYPESGDAWFEQNPLTFDEWVVTNA